jgi:hypothetical protein
LAERAQAGEAGGFARQLEIVGRRVVGGAGLRRLAVDADEFTVLRVRQRLEEEQVHQAEHRGVQADAEGEGQQRDGGEAGGLGELAEGEFEVGEHGRK